MKILFASESTGISGGANQMVINAKELIKRKHKVYAFMNENGETAQRLKENGVAIIHTTYDKNKEIFRGWQLKKIINDIKPDIVHSHHSRAHSVCLAAKHFIDFNLVVTRRVIFPIPKNPFSLYKYRSSKINKFIAVCEYIKDELIKAKVKEEKIELIYSAVDFSKFDKALKSKKEIKEGNKFNVITVGNYSSFKGHDYLLEAIKLLSSELSSSLIKFIIVGKFTENLKDKVKALGISDYVEILGERKDVPDLLSMASLMVVPSLQEGICGVCIEAAASLLPVIGTNIGGIPEVIKNNETGILVPPADSVSIKNAIKNVYLNYDNALIMAKKQYSQTYEKFSIDNVMNKIENLYERLI